MPRSQKQVIRVAEQNLDIQLPQLSWRHCLHRRLSTDRHEDRRLDHAMRGMQSTAARTGLWVFVENFEFHVFYGNPTASHQMARGIPAIFDLAQRWLVGFTAINGNRASR